MTYDDLFVYLSLVYDYLLQLLGRVISKITENPIVMTAVFIGVAVPCVLLVFDFILNFADSTSDTTMSSFRLYKAFKRIKLKKDDVSDRENFNNSYRRNNLTRHTVSNSDIIEAENYARYHSPSSPGPKKKYSNPDIDVKYSEDD